MAKPKPPEEFDTLTVRLPMSLANRVRSLAQESRTAAGRAMSANQYCTAIIQEAVESEITVRERLRYDLVTPPTLLKVAEPEGEN